MLNISLVLNKSVSRHQTLKYIHFRPANFFWIKMTKIQSFKFIKIVQTTFISNNKTNKIKPQAKKLNFMDSFRPVYYFSRIFGLLPFSFIYDSNGDVQKTKITKFDGLWFLISMFVYVLMSFFLKNDTVPTLFSVMSYTFTLFRWLI